MRPNLISKNRLEALSDGIFAIILTLLVLEIKVPSLQDPLSTNELAKALADRLHVFIGWVLSFFLVCITWVHHHRLLEQHSRINLRLFFMHALLLMTISFLPFPTGLLGQYPDNALAVSVMGMVLGFCGLCFANIRYYLIRHSMLLPSVDLAHFKAISKGQLLVGPGLYLTAAGLAWVHPYISLVLYFGISIFFTLGELDSLAKPEA